MVGCMEFLEANIYHGNNKLMFETSLSYVFGELDL